MIYTLDTIFYFRYNILYSNVKLIDGQSGNKEICVIHRGYYNKDVRSNRNLDLQ
ncbi:MAG: hypothetical protein PV345_02240 [Wolbachia sp.]|nr:hypothetical protein [Wolbachia sp.]